MKKVSENVPNYTLTVVKSVIARAENYSVLMVYNDDCYDLFLKKHDGNAETAFMPMFALPKRQQSALTALDIAFKNAPSYDDLFKV